MPTKKAQQLALATLQVVGLERIGLYRATKCSVMEIFYVMFIRALMSKEQTIIINSPASVIDTLKKIDRVLEKITLFKSEKNILVLDVEDNQNYYKGSLCSTIKLS